MAEEASRGAPSPSIWKSTLMGISYRANNLDEKINR
jgi:hypothetical protein